MSETVVQAADLVPESQVVELLEGCREFSGVCPEAQDWCANRNRLRRFIVGHNGNVSNAKKTLKWCVEHRTELETWNIEPEQCRQELRTGKFYVRSVDKQGHPVILQRGRRADWRVPERVRIQTLILVLDELERRLDRGDYNKDGRWVMMLDQGGQCECPEKFTIAFQKEVIFTLLRNYPERMIKTCVIDTSWFVNVIWAAIKPLLDSRVKQKIMFCKRKNDGFGNQICEDLIQVCGPEQVEKEYGGQDKFEWNPDMHWDITKLPMIGSNQIPKPTKKWKSNSAVEELDNAVTYPVPTITYPAPADTCSEGDPGRGGWVTPPEVNTGGIAIQIQQEPDPEEWNNDEWTDIRGRTPRSNGHSAPARGLVIPAQTPGHSVGSPYHSQNGFANDSKLLNQIRSQVRDGRLPAGDLQLLRRDLDEYLMRPQSNLQIHANSDASHPKGLYVSYREMFLSVLSMGLGAALAITMMTNKDSCA